MGTPIGVSEYYGYSKSSNGVTTVVTGRVVKFANGKVTMDDITENTFFFVGEGKQVPDKTVKSDRKRTVASVQLFHVPHNVMSRTNTVEHDCNAPENRETDGILYRCSKCKTIL